MSTASIAVAGLARCGTSLTMQMLAAAGIRTVGEWPAFEADGHHAGAGVAVKWLDPHRTPQPFRRGVVIWLDRDPIQQAKSQAKLLRELMGMDADWRPFVRSLGRERILARRAIEPFRKLDLTFERLVLEPHYSAFKIATFLGRAGLLLDGATMPTVSKMAHCVRERPSGTSCAPDMAMELALVAGPSRVAV